MEWKQGFGEGLSPLWFRDLTQPEEELKAGIPGLQFLLEVKEMLEAERAG